MPTSIRTKGVRSDHISWTCNEILDGNPSNPCYALNDIQDKACGKCNKRMAPGSEAVNGRGEIIGKYEGRGVWDYDCEMGPGWAYGADCFVCWNSGS